MSGSAKKAGLNFRVDNTNLWQVYADNAGSLNNFYIRFNQDESKRFITIKPNGNVGIGLIDPQYKLDVKGTIRADEIKVNLEHGADFVFEENYNLMPLNEVENYIKENKHLPEIAPATEMETEGINLAEMNTKLLQKIEELTLYVIDLQKQVDELKNSTNNK